MATENLKVKITADASQAKAEIGKFKDSLKGTVSAGNNATASIGKLTVAMGGLLVAAKGVKKAISTALEVAATGDAIKDNAQKVFMSTTAYQEWGYVLKQNGIEINALKVGMRQFAQKVAEGDSALAKYGITATNVEDAFGQAIANIQNMSTETEKVAAATELFGSRALELFPILNLTNQETANLMQTYRLLGGTMSNELIAASDTCNDSLTAMKAAWGGLVNLLGAYLLPVISKVVQWLTILIAKVRIVLAAVFGIKETFGSSSKKKSVAGAAASTAGSTGKTAKNLGKSAKNAKELKRTLMGIDELTKLQEQATAAAAGGGGGGGIGDIGGGDLGDLEGLTDLLDSDTLKELDEFRQKIQKIAKPLNGLYKILRGLVKISFGKFKSGLSDIWDGLKKVFPILGDVEKKWKDFKKAAKEKIEGVVGFKLPTWSDLKAKWENLKAKFTGKNVSMGISIPSFSSFKTKWNNLLSNFKDKTVSIGLKFSAAASDLKKWINTNVIAKINAKFSKVPILKNHLIPYLAKGGVLTMPTTAMLGEYAGARQNPEIATPQSLMYETIQKANGDMVSAFATMTRQVIAAIENKDLSVNIGDEQIARSAQRGNTAYYNRTGKALLTI